MSDPLTAAIKALDDYMAALNRGDESGVNAACNFPHVRLAGGKVVKVDRVEWVTMADAQTAMNALQSGDIDFVENPSFDTLSILEADKDIKVEKIDDFTVKVIFAKPTPFQLIRNALPALSSVVPKHIYEKISAEELPNYLADDNVSGGPFQIVERKEGEFIRLVQNPNWFGKKPAMDQLIFRTFETAEAQYNALKAGDLDAVDDVPGKIFATIMAGDEPNITGIAGNQGSFSELAMNSSCPTGIGDGHVALKDPNVRRAINWSLDRQLMVDKILNGFGKPAVGISAAANPAFDYQVAADQTYSYDPAKANALLDEAGWIDTNGDGVRDKDGVELKLRYFDRSVGGGSDTTPFITGFLKDVGIATDVKTFDEDSLAAIQSKSEFDLYTWGWSPYADPDNMLSNFTSSAVPTDPAVGGYNDGNWCNAEYDALYAQQHVELDPVKRADLIQQMHKIFVNDGPYAVLYKYDNLQAFRSDRWQNFERQPAEVGPIMFTQTSSAYLNLEPVSGDSGGGGGTNTIVVIGIALVAAGVVFTLVRGRRKKSADDRA